MQMVANTNNDVLALTMDRYSSTLISNMPKKSVLLNWISKNGRSTEGGWSGKSYRQALEYGLNTNAMWFVRAERFRVDETEAFAEAQFFLRQFVGTSIEIGVDDVINDGKEAVINYYEAKINNLNKSLQLMMAKSAWYDGSENDGKSFAGLRHAIVDDPTLPGMVGGIGRDRVDQEGRFWWQNKVFKKNSLPAPGAGAPNARPMYRSLLRLAKDLKTVDGDSTDIILTGGDHWIDFNEEVSEKQVFQDVKKAGMGFNGVNFLPLDASVVLDSMAPRGNASYAINSEHIYLRKSKRWMKKLPTANPMNQDVSAQRIVGEGNFVFSNLAVQGVLLDA
jgi:hypothetical protein